MGEEDAGNEGSKVCQQKFPSNFNVTVKCFRLGCNGIRVGTCFSEANLLMIIAELYTEATMADEVTGL